MRAVAIWNLHLMQTLAINAHCINPCIHCYAPLFKCALPVIFVYKVFDLHLLELAKTKNKIARRDFISKSFTNLPQTKRHLWVKRINYIFKIDKHTLRSLRAEI